VQPVIQPKTPPGGQKKWAVTSEGDRLGGRPTCFRRSFSRRCPFRDPEGEAATGLHKQAMRPRGN